MKLESPAKPPPVESSVCHFGKYDGGVLTDTSSEVSSAVDAAPPMHSGGDAPMPWRARMYVDRRLELHELHVHCPRLASPVSLCKLLPHDGRVQHTGCHILQADILLLANSAWVALMNDASMPS